MDKEEIKKLIKEWLETLDETPECWDGVFASDKGMAKRFITGFFNWLEEKESNKSK